MSNTLKRKPLAIDLCCGKGGWTNGLLYAGFHVIGFDLFHFKEYQGELVIQDIRTLDGRQFRKTALIVASPPCEQFTVNDMRMFHPSPPYPALGIELFQTCMRIGTESGVPFIIENVRGAQKFVGRSVNHAGPFHLWGTGVPAILPHECYNAQKGFKLGRCSVTGKREIAAGRMYGSKSRKRKEWTATIAMVPESLSRFVGEIYRGGHLA